jgi:hypothetical protein
VNDKRTIQVLLWALKPIANLRRSIPLPYALTFLTVALQEGKPRRAAWRSHCYAEQLQQLYKVPKRGDAKLQERRYLSAMAVQWHRVHVFPVQPFSSSTFPLSPSRSRTRGIRSARLAQEAEGGD